MIKKSGYLIDAEYLTEVEFIPKEGRLFVDTSGICFVGPFKKHAYINWKRAERAKNCLKLFKERGDVFTTKGVLEELKVILNNYKKKKRKIKNEKNLRIKGITTSLPDRYGEIIRIHKNHSKTYQNLYDYLDESSREVDLGSEEEREEICSYIHKCDKESSLSNTDIELLVAAIYSGDSTGIFTADASIISTYDAAVEHFSLDNCFVADGIHSKSFYILMSRA